MLLGAMSLPASADKEDLTPYRYIPVEAIEDALLYELKPFAATYIEAGKQYGVDPVFLAAKDADCLLYTSFACCAYTIPCGTHKVNE